MSSPATRAASPSRFDLVVLHRLAVVAILGFASGLPLALTGQAMQAWLSTSGVDIATIGFLSIVSLPYTFKFLWAPLMDRFELPWLGRRRGWIVLSQRYQPLLETLADRPGIVVWQHPDAHSPVPRMAA